MRNAFAQLVICRIYEYADRREAAFDIHTSWVTPDNFPGYVEQEVQFRFDNGVWNCHSRKRGVELTIEGSTPFKRKTTMNNHYNGRSVEPNGERSQRGYGLEVLEQFAREAAFVEYGGPATERAARLGRADVRRDGHSASPDVGTRATVGLRLLFDGDNRPCLAGCGL